MLLFKIDFERTCNHVDWDFLDKVLETKGFVYKWRMWMWSCRRSMSYYFLINDSLTGSVVATRSLRQGDPVPLPVPSCRGCYEQNCYECVEGNFFVPFEKEEGKVALAHLQFADDTLFFCTSNENSILTLNHILEVFEEVSGLRIKRGNCSVMDINRNE